MQDKYSGRSRGFGFVRLPTVHANETPKHGRKTWLVRRRELFLSKSTTFFSRWMIGALD